MTPNVHRIAMWSGPRNISTALMRAWENRPDTMVHDEPFYAYYLKETGIPHPGAEEIMATYPTNPNRVMNQLLGAVPEGITIYYQKHMCHEYCCALSEYLHVSEHLAGEGGKEG